MGVTQAFAICPLKSNADLRVQRAAWTSDHCHCCLYAELTRDTVDWVYVQREDIPSSFRRQVRVVCWAAMRYLSLVA